MLQVVATIASTLLLESTNVVALLLLSSVPTIAPTVVVSAIAPVVPIVAARARVADPRSVVASAVVATRWCTIAVLDGNFPIIRDTSWWLEPKILAGDGNLKTFVKY